MPANTSPIFTLTPVIGLGQILEANTNRDGTGSLYTILTGGTNGTRIHRISIAAPYATTAGMVRLYIGDGSAIRLWREIPVTAITPSASTMTYAYQLELFGEEALVLPSGYTLQASTHNNETFVVIAEGGNY